MRACTRARCFSPYIPAFFCPVHTRESLGSRLPTSNMTILPAKQAACDLCGLHGSAMQRLRLENWSTIVLLQTWRCEVMLTCRYIYLSVSICVYTCVITYEMTYTFQLLATLLTIYTYGYTHNSICVHTSTHLYTYISTMHMPMCTYFHIFTHHIYIHFSDSEVYDL